MSDIMLQHAREFKRSNDPKALQEGVLICLSRPDEDSVVEKILSTVKTPLEDNGLWETSVENLINESIAAIKDSSRSSADQVTYSVVLENMISELRPDFIKQYKSPGFESRMIEKIAVSEVELNGPAKAEKKLNLMRSGSSPSEISQKLLDKREEILNAEKKSKSKTNVKEELD